MGMALNSNTFSPFIMRSPFDDSFFKSSWEDGWMIPSRSQMLQNPFKGFQSMFNEEDTKVDEDEAKMEGRINTSEYKPEEKKEDGSVYVQRCFSRSYTLPKEAQADKMVSHLSSEGVLLISTPKSTPAITNEVQKQK